jgi:hypothetical protein
VYSNNHPFYILVLFSHSIHLYEIFLHLSPVIVMSDNDVRNPVEVGGYVQYKI